MATSTPSLPAPAFRAHPYTLWGVALAAFVVGDVATTAVGLATPGVAEAGPVAAPLLERFGVVAIPLLKAATVVPAYVAWRLLPQSWAPGVPLGLAATGLFATGWNVVVLVGA